MHDGHICDRFERSHRVRSFRHRQRGIHVTVFRKKEKVNTFCSWSAQRGRIRRGKKKKKKSRRRNLCERFCRTCPSPSRRGRSRAAKALYLGRRDDADEEDHHHHHHRTTTTRIPISILPRKKRGERGEGEGAFLESWEETEEEEESASSSSNHPQIKRQHSQQEHPSYQKNYIMERPKQPTVFLLFFVSVVLC